MIADTNLCLEFGDELETKIFLEAINCLHSFAGKGKVVYLSHHSSKSYKYTDFYFEKDWVLPFAELIEDRDEKHDVYIQVETWCYDYRHDIIYFRRKEDLALAKLIL